MIPRFLSLDDEVVVVRSAEMKKKMRRGDGLEQR